jgi:AcrR family transcriptional regulator
MPKSFSEQEKEIIRKQLLDQGLKHFSSYGFKKTNVDEIARAVGISKGAFYRFYESKELLFMDVIEQVEIRGRQEIMAAIDQPGPTPRFRLYAIFVKAFGLFRELPIMRLFSGSDFGLLLGQVPMEKFQEHIASDQGFFDELITACREAGIPIQVSAQQVVTLLYPLVVSFLTESGSEDKTLLGNINGHLELIAAYCLGEVTLKYQEPGVPVLDNKEGMQE